MRPNRSQTAKRMGRSGAIAFSHLEQGRDAQSVSGGAERTGRFRLRPKFADQGKEKAMELAALGSSSVLRDADVMTSRASPGRFRSLLIVLVVIGARVEAGRRPASCATSRAIMRPRPAISIGLTRDPSSFLPYAPGLLLVVLLGFVLGGPLLMAGRSPRCPLPAEEIGIGLADVVGADVVVEEVVKTLTLFLGHRTFEERMGGTACRGVLFEGPPGTGKTYIAKAMAAEAGVPFLSCPRRPSSPCTTADKPRDTVLLRSPPASWPARGGAIGFIEEIDAIGAARGGPGRRPWP